MATKSVATKKPLTEIPGTEQDLWMRGGDVLTVRIDRNSKGFPANAEALDHLHEVIIGLAKAVVCIADDLEAGSVKDQWHTGLALNGIADAIVLHTTLAEGVSSEMHRDEAPVLTVAA
ncbi:MAG TPA: hypothetical protein VJ862_09275 [Rhodanobacteraceae bacterium]|nr:hypothetical protein [Rhodanobacteraceae bacterium]